MDTCGEQAKSLHKMQTFGGGKSEFATVANSAGCGMSDERLAMQAECSAICGGFSGEPEPKSTIIVDLPLLSRERIEHARAPP